MNTFDISPFFRSTVGFDRLFDQLGTTFNNDTSWPQYDVAKTGEEAYRITIAVPGYHQDDISLESRGNLLTVKGERRTEQEQGEFLYRGIGGQSFTRTFQLAEYVKVENARLSDGLLQIDLKRELPESMLPRKIDIEVTEGSSQKAVTHDQVADKAA